MKHRIFMAAAALMALAACTSDNDITEPQQPTTETASTPITITATYGDAPATRTAYTESGADISATWESGDEVLVVYDGQVSTLTLTDGEGTASATFTGTIQGTPTAQSLVNCYVRNQNNPDALTVSGGDLIYSDAAFLAQDGTLAAAAKCNTHSGSTTYGNGTDLRVAFAVNTSILKFTVLAPYGVAAGTEGATLTYTSGETTLAEATFTVGTGGTNTIYMAVPAGQYTGAQTLVYKSGETEVSKTLSASKASFKYGQTYSREINFDNATKLENITTEYTVKDGEVLTGTLGWKRKISIAAGATVTLRGMTINGEHSSAGSGYKFAGLTCLGDATIILADGTTNNVKGFNQEYPGIFVPSGSILTIRGTGSLNASSNGEAAGIGSGYQMACGNIVIEGGNITATGSALGAGIGSGYFNSSCGNITISGGTVTATGGSRGAGIGSGSYQCTCGNISISGGTVNATGGDYGAGIGSGSDGSSCGSITISGGTGRATKGEDAPYSIGKGDGSTCGTITIGGTNYGTNSIATSPFTW